MKTAFIIMAFLQLPLLGCGSGPNLKNKQSYLDKESYKDFTIVAGVPVFKTKNRKSVITGGVYQKGPFGLPLSGVVVSLLNKKSALILMVKTNHKGRYKIVEKIEDGDYVLRYKYRGQSQEVKFSLKGYESQRLNVYLN